VFEPWSGQADASCRRGMRPRQPIFGLKWVDDPGHLLELGCYAGHGSMPRETQDYVLAITGHDVEEWRGDKHPASASPELAEPCLTSVAKLRVAHGPEASPIVSGLFAPWGVQTSASFSKGSALRAFARTRHDYYSVIGGMTPFVLGSVCGAEARACSIACACRHRPTAKRKSSATAFRPPAAPGSSEELSATSPRPTCSSPWRRASVGGISLGPAARSSRTWPSRPTTSNPERTVALRKLLESKDAAVRAKLVKP